MPVIAESDVKKDARNRITLPMTDVSFDHYHVEVYDDGHIELHPQVLSRPNISVRTLGMMDEAIVHLDADVRGQPANPDALLALLEDE